jgi:hypothetical protein
VKVATPPMYAIRNITRAFGGSIPLKTTAPLQIEVTALDPPRNVFEGDSEHPPLTHRDVFTALPFQLDERRHLVAFYVMTRDATKPIAPERYRLKISGAKGSGRHGDLIPRRPRGEGDRRHGGPPSSSR